MQLSIAIILKDSFQSVGIKTIFKEFFGYTPIVFQNVSMVSGELFDLYITDSELYSLNLDFFIPKRYKTIIITSEMNAADNSNYVCKYTEFDDLIDFFSNVIQDTEKNCISSQSELSNREIEVLKLIATGLMNKEIAEHLNISINTVLTHRKNITSKLGIRTVSGLSFYAMMNGYITSI